MPMSALQEVVMLHTHARLPPLAPASPPGGRLVMTTPLQAHAGKRVNLSGVPFHLGDCRAECSSTKPRRPHSGPGRYCQFFVAGATHQCTALPKIRYAVDLQHADGSTASPLPGPSGALLQVLYICSTSFFVGPTLLIHLLEHL